MGNLRGKINLVSKGLHLSDEDFRLVRLTRYKEILHSILEKFTSLKPTQINNWWWEFFVEPGYSFYSENALDVLLLLVDENKTVWFVIEDERKEDEHYWLYEGKLSAIIQVLEELSFEEYYVVSRSLDWIICENHHNFLIGSGEKIVRKMKKVSQTNNSDKIKL